MIKINSVRRNEHEKNIKDAYKKSISIYDEILVGKKWWSKLYLSTFWGGVSDMDIAIELLNRIPKDFTGKILDIPVGTGVFTANHYKNLKDAIIVGVDYSLDMLDKCRDNMKHNSVDIELLQGDVGALEFEDASFDLLVSMYGFHAFPDKEKAYDTVLRVLKPGGRFLGCFYIRDQLKTGDFIVNNVLAPKGWFSPPRIIML